MRVHEDVVAVCKQRLRVQGAEFGSTTSRPRRRGWFDLVAMKYSIMINGITKLGITKLDVLTGFDEIRVCTEYRVNGKPLKYFPTDVGTLSSIEPVYETFPGWDEDITAARSFDDLPANAKSYLNALREMTGVEIQHISVGPKRAQTIELTH